jgi:MFS family permease
MTELTRRRRLLVLAICCMSLLIVGMDNTIVTVALPSIRRDLHASVEGLQWTMDAYTLVLAALLILAGSTADRIGRRRTFQTGLVLFTLGSLLCSLAPGLGWLIAFRALQAVGGSMLNPVAMSIITNVFTDPRERAQAIGMWAGVVGISLAVGPIAGGLLTQSIGWRAIFWVNVPIGIAACVLAAIFVPESRAPRPRRIDPIGQVLVFMLAIAIAALVVLLRYERRRADPLLELRFFRSVPFSGATAIAVCAFGSFSGFLFMYTLYLQDVRGLDALDAGLFLLPMALTVGLLAPVSGRVVGARGPRLPLFIAGIMLTLAALPLTRLSDSTSYGWLVGCLVLCGLGFAFVNAPVTNTAMSGMPREQAGVAAAIASTSRQVGNALGIAVIGSVVNTGSTGFTGRFAAATHPAWWIVAGTGLAVLGIGAVSTGRRARATAEVTAGEFPEQDPVELRAS